MLSQDGSSPLARGTPGTAQPGDGGRRFIPARAGNTGGGGGAATGGAVHPRSRGEHHVGGGTLGGRRGSSPLARGTLGGPAHRPRAVRFIPARAGNTPRRSPRPRGVDGSSPLARGNTDPGLDVAHLRPVHPRSRGEHRSISRVMCVSDGSSPLARGTLPLDVEGLGGERFIPARAGNTARPPRRRPPAPVHPRSRGEHSSQNSLIDQDFFDVKERTDDSAHNSEDRKAVCRFLRCSLKFRSARRGMPA